MIFHQHALADLDTLELDQETTELYLTSNAKRLFSLA